MSDQSTDGKRWAWICGCSETLILTGPEIENTEIKRHWTEDCPHPPKGYRSGGQR